MITIKNIRRGRGDRAGILYAEIWDDKGLLVAATFEYCIAWIERNMP